VLPLLLAGVIALVFLVLILAGRPKGFVRIASTAAGLAVLVLGLTTLGLWVGGAI